MNDTYNTTDSSFYQNYDETGDDDHCNLLPSSNSSLPLAANWENIPETLLVNGIIGSILFISFLIMTKIAWNRSYRADDFIDQSLITFLYGYRDPDRWYVIPRFEFLKQSYRHHSHDLENSNIYVPPKLPLANPIELIDYESKPGDSLDDSSTERKTVDSLTTKSSKILNKSIVRQQPETRILKRQVLSKSTSRDKRPNEQIKKSDIMLNNRLGLRTTTNKEITSNYSGSTIQTDVEGLNRGKQIKSKELTKNSSHTSDPLAGSFFYPSILTAEQLQASYLSRKLNKFFSLFFWITDADIIYAKGIDAYEYLLFQRHLILIMFITNLFCLGLILPVHCYGGSGHSNLLKTSFQTTTIKNLEADSIHYWAHLTSAVCILGLTIVVLNSYRESIVNKNNSQLARRTLLIGNIPVEQRNRVKLLKIIQDYFSRSVVEAIQFVYDTSLLEQYQSQLDSILVAKEYCFYKKRKYNQEIMVKPSDVNEGQYCYGNCRLCSFFYICCCFWPCETKIPGTIYYPQREQYYRDKIKTNLEQMIKKPSEYAFVTFKSYRHAKRVMSELTRLKTEAMNERLVSLLRRNLSIQQLDSGLKNLDREENSGRKKARNTEFLSTTGNAANDPLDVKNNPHVRSIRSPTVHKWENLDKNIKQVDKKEQRVAGKTPASIPTKLQGPIAWSVRYAPLPDNVEYGDLLYLAATSKFTTALLHILMIVIFIFVTTPNVVLSILERWSVLNPEKAKQMTGFQGIFINYLTVIVQIITTALLPSIIILISRQIPYEDSSSKTHSMMWKVYLFLVLMVIIMPSVGMKSAQSFLVNYININPKCLFPTDNGAYFINYVISSIFLSTILELIKPIDIVFYYFVLWTGRSYADFEGGRQMIAREFSIDMQHTSVLLVFTVVMTYTISCPLIAPAGLLYLIVKHAVDHYHLFYTYFTRKADKNLQNTIEIFVRVALLLMLLQTALAISQNTGTTYFSLISQIVFCISSAIFMFNCFFDCTSRARNSTIKRDKYQKEFCACFYLPRVMEDLLRQDAIPENCISRQV